MKALLIENNDLIIEWIKKRLLNFGFSSILIAKTEEEAKIHIRKGEFYLAIINLDFTKKTEKLGFLNKIRKEKKNICSLGLLDTLSSNHPQIFSIVWGAQPNIDFFEKIKVKDKDEINIDYLNGTYKSLKEIVHHNIIPNDSESMIKEIGFFMEKVKEIISDKETCDILIVTALPEEYEAMKSKFTNSKDLSHRSCIVNLPISDERVFKIIISHQARMGQGSAAALATLLCSKYKPSYVLLVGIAGGKKDDVKLEDVVVADFIIDTTCGRMETDGRIVEWRTCETNRELFHKSKIFSNRYSRWKEITHHADIFSGNDVIEDANILTNHKLQWRNAVAVEMEGAGAVTAIDDYISNPKPKFLMIRGISDYADKSKRIHSKKHREKACNIAATYAFEFLNEVIIDLP